MPLNITISGTSTEITNCFIDYVNKKVLLHQSTPDNPQVSTGLEIDHSIQSPTQPYQNAAYYVALFGHELWPQSRLLTLKKDGNAVGAMFSIEVLTSGFAWSGDESEFRKAAMNDYATIALEKLCVGEVRGEYKSTLAGETTLSLTTIYSPDTVIVILKIDDFFPGDVIAKQDATEYSNYFKEYICSFYQYGLFPQPQRRITQQEPLNKCRRFSSLAGYEINNRNLALQRLSNNISPSQKEYLLVLFHEIDPYERNPFFRFFLYYQIYERWMQEIFEKNVQQFTTQLASGAYSDPFLLRDELGNLSDVLKERKRLGEIFAANQTAHDHCAAILALSNAILVACGQDQQTNIIDAVYKIRNRLVHSFAELQMQKAQFHELADLVLFLICSTAFSYTASNKVHF